MLPCGTDKQRQVKIELLSFWSVRRWVSQYSFKHLFIQNSQKYSIAYFIQKNWKKIIQKLLVKLISPLLAIKVQIWSRKSKQLPSLWNWHFHFCQADPYLGAWVPSGTFLTIKSPVGYLFFTFQAHSRVKCRNLVRFFYSFNSLI